MSTYAMDPMEGNMDFFEDEGFDAVADDPRQVAVAASSNAQVKEVAATTTANGRRSVEEEENDIARPTAVNTLTKLASVPDIRTAVAVKKELPEETSLRGPSKFTSLLQQRLQTIREKHAKTKERELALAKQNSLRQRIDAINEERAKNEAAKKTTATNTSVKARKQADNDSQTQQPQKVEKAAVAASSNSQQSQTVKADRRASTAYSSVRLRTYSEVVRRRRPESLHSSGSRSADMESSRKARRLATDQMMTSGAGSARNPPAAAQNPNAAADEQPSRFNAVINFLVVTGPADVFGVTRGLVQSPAHITVVMIPEGKGHPVARLLEDCSSRTDIRHPLVRELTCVKSVHSLDRCNFVVCHNSFASFTNICNEMRWSSEAMGFIFFKYCAIQSNTAVVVGIFYTPNATMTISSGILNQLKAQILGLHARFLMGMFGDTGELITQLATECGAAGTKPICQPFWMSPHYGAGDGCVGLYPAYIIPFGVDEVMVPDHVDAPEWSSITHALPEAVIDQTIGWSRVPKWDNVTQRLELQPFITRVKHKKLTFSWVIPCTHAILIYCGTAAKGTMCKARHTSQWRNSWRVSQWRD